MFWRFTVITPSPGITQTRAEAVFRRPVAYILPFESTTGTCGSSAAGSPPSGAALAVDSNSRRQPKIGR
eukprot:CAMPEP_0118964148 /NCGR_PEP_ID=MMETSP1173-20130426/1895_1 /TAXON_ID=1034831 /ORGANISM="Rhizochromulina marina cf, Strain CCMP1243" /LENGTH=68 /DNA_ID=CAMNT_0006912577 /DNA_START=280 /DNA_END=482 /DNA_ORIENTATION=-